MATIIPRPITTTIHYDHIAGAVIHLIAEMIGYLVREIRDTDVEDRERQQGAGRERGRELPVERDERQPLSELMVTYE